MTIATTFKGLGQREKIAAAVLVITHSVGAVGLNLDISRSLFESLSVVNLLLSFILIVWTEEVKSARFIGFICIAFLTGIIAEIIGVETGLLFGDYLYTDVLGPKAWEVPLIIGINWAALAYAYNNVSAAYIKQPVVAAITAATLMTATDILLEELAIKHNFWVWLQNGRPPLSNFIAWFGLGLLLSIFYQFNDSKTLNRTNIIYLICLILFLITDFCLK